jgi:hypothetical protein
MLLRAILLLKHLFISTNESITIIDQGIGINNIPKGNIKISGPGYQPATPDQREEEHTGFAEIDTNTDKKISFGNFVEYDWNGSEDVNVSVTEFNKTYLNVAVSNPGFDYAMPLEFKVIGGRPQSDRADIFTSLPPLPPLPPLQSYVQSYDEPEKYVFEEAEFEVTSVGPNGSIEELNVTHGGKGYVDLSKLNEDEKEILNAVLNEQGYSISEYPTIVVTGGGGHGAKFKAEINATDGSISGASLISGGRGYVNTIRDNFPTIKHTPSISASEKNATLAVLLGGYLEDIPRCTACEAGAPDGHDVAGTPSPYSHAEPWIEIWDRGRSEELIDTMGARAHAAPKVVNGEIVKVIVTKSGTGYIDPVVMVRDAPPKHVDYFDEEVKEFRRKWKCTFRRTLPTGEKIECGHIHLGLYPPEECPGETDETLPFEDENGTLIYATGSDLTAWKTRHDALKNHEACTESDAHLGVQFLSRKCWGTKTNYILHDNAIYRNPRADWLELDANLTIIAKNGRIREIIVDSPGSNYYATQIHVEGTGGGVDAIPVFDEHGLNSKVIFNDPRIRNTEIDLVARPIGAGQGFRERPWAWDETPRTESYSSIVEDNNPIFGKDERVDLVIMHADYTSTWTFGQPRLADYLGDRIMQVEILDPGLYDASTLLDVTLEYNSSGSLDQNRDGTPDFIQAEITAFSTQRLTKFSLDDNASYDQNKSAIFIERGLFEETPKIQLLDSRNISGDNIGRLDYSTESPIQFIRNNDKIGYDPDTDKNYIDLYIDDNFSGQLFYGEGITSSNSSMVVPSFGGKILVTDGVPGGSWAIDEGLEKPNFSYSDQYGYYAFTGLDWGIYNISVFLEDQKFQESTFRPKNNPTRVSQFVYVPGFPDLELEADNYGKGQSTLLWSFEARDLTRESSGPLDKILMGVGRGFNPALDAPELTIIPHPDNQVKITPNINVNVLVDGSLKLEIIDDENTTQYFPGDKFTITYSSTITGIDFLESDLFSESNQSFQSGVLSSWDYDESSSNMDRYQAEPRLVISPSDGNGANILEAFLSTRAIGEEVANVFRAQVFEANGTEIDASNVNWRVSLDFNSSEGNNSNIVQLEDALGNRDLNATGNQTDLYLFSTLRIKSGSIHGIEPIYGGSDYKEDERILINGSIGYGFEANITDVNETTGQIKKIDVLNRGYGYTYPMEFHVSGSEGSGALFEPVLPRGYLILEANFTMPNGEILSAEVRIRASDRQVLDSKEKWLDLYLDSFVERNSSWWEQDLNASNNFQDSDDDNLSNYNEWRLGSDPFSLDTDRDNLFDYNESLFGSSPLSVDTDGDGLNDDEENASGTKPLIIDSDGDGILDGADEKPLDNTSTGFISGRIYQKSIYDGARVFYRFDEISVAEKYWTDTNGWIDPSNKEWKGAPNFFYQEGLTYGETYKFQAFLELNDTESSPKKDPGDPFDEETITLTTNFFGRSLKPIDPPPTINIKSDSNYTIDINDTKQTQTITWDDFDIFASDPSFPDDNWTIGDDDPPSGCGILLEGNFTEYLIGFPENGYDYNASYDINLSKVPVGKYSLFYTAFDQFQNFSPRIEHNITIIDSQPPFLTFIDFNTNKGITTENNSTISDVYTYNEDLEENITFTFLDPQSATADLNWSLGKTFNLNEFFILARDNKSGEVEWNVTYDGTINEPIDTSTLNPEPQDLNFSAIDGAGNVANLVIRVHTIDDHPPQLSITGDSVDGNNKIMAYKNRGFILEEEIQILVDDSFGNYTPAKVYYDMASKHSFDVDWGGIQNLETETGETLIMPDENNDSTNYTLTFSYSDASNNTGSVSLHVEVKEPAIILSGKAMDGYLNDAEVKFQSENETLFTTTDDGNFTFFFTDEEFEKVDSDGNMQLDAAEGVIIVSGGEDIDTGALFLGELRADAEAEIVSPLTSLLYYMYKNLGDLNESKTRLLDAFNLDHEVNLHTFDPYAELDSNNSKAAAVLLASIRLANVINIAEEILPEVADASYVNGDFSRAILTQIAQEILKQSGEIDLQYVIEQRLSFALKALALNNPLGDDEIESLAGLIGKSDPHKFKNDFDKLTNIGIKTLMINSQKWLISFGVYKIFNDVLEEKLPNTNNQEPNQIIPNTNLNLLAEIPDSLVDDLLPTYRRSNQYSPRGEDFITFFSSVNLEDECLWKIQASDADGDTIYHSLISGNFDYDGDGKDALSLTTEGSLCVQDFDDFKFFAGNTVNLEIMLDDMHGGYGFLAGQILIKNLLALESASLENSWYQSEWFGSFYTTEGSWVYHHPIGWLYVHPDGNDGYWFWDHSWKNWWWSKNQAFPWIYRDDFAQWGYLMIMPNEVNVFDLDNRRWRRRK